MEHQEWFEKFSIRLGADENRFHGQIWVKEEWRIIQLALLKMALHVLSPKEKEVVVLVFFEGYTEREAAEELKISKTRLHNLKKKALKRLSKSSFLKLALAPQGLKKAKVQA
ncbi:MAG: hypothetical protein HQ596_03070 [Candidatus Saganbacteria bacterium]|nr:hypothetical protein [Candidatus Saganbacteria bacterium]